MANEQVKVQITADGSQVPGEVAKVKKSLSGVADSGNLIGQSFSKLGGLIGGALSIGAAVGFLKHVNDIADSLNDLAGNLGASASGLQTIQLAAAQAGGSVEGANSALTKLNLTVGEAVNGNKSAAAAFSKLGLSAREVAGMKTDEAFAAVIDKLSKVENSAQRAALGTDIFGKSYKDVAGLATEGASALDEVNKRLEEQGAKLSDLDVAKIGTMNDELQFQKTIVENLGIKFVSGLAPSVGVATSTVAEMIGRIGGATEAGSKFGVIMTFAIKGVEAGAYLIGAAFELVRYAVTNMLLNITVKLASFTYLLANLAKTAGLDTLSQALRNFTESTVGFAESLQDISKSALANAKQALEYAKQAGLEMLAAPETFAKEKAKMDAAAEAAAARNSATQGAATATAAAGNTAYDPNAARMSTDTGYGTDRKAFGPELVKDPLADPRYLYEQQLAENLKQLASDQALEQLNISQARDASLLDQLFLRNDLMIAAEEAKNMTLGSLMGDLVQMGIQQGGAMGKFAKAYAIASTIWTTAAAIMEAMGPKGPGFPQNIAVAAKVAAMGAMQLATIRKTNIGSSGSIASPGGAGAAGGSAALGGTPSGANQADDKAPNTVTQIIVNGSMFAAQETVDWLVTQIGDAVNGRDLVFINSNSRQAMELAGMPA